MPGRSARGLRALADAALARRGTSRSHRARTLTTPRTSSKQSSTDSMPLSHACTCSRGKGMRHSVGCLRIPCAAPVQHFSCCSSSLYRTELTSNANGAPDTMHSMAAPARRVLLNHSPSKDLTPDHPMRQDRRPRPLNRNNKCSIRAQRARSWLPDSPREASVRAR